LPERRKMMQVWADYLDSCAEGDDPRVIVAALRNVAEVNGLMKTSRIP